MTSPANFNSAPLTIATIEQAIRDAGLDRPILVRIVCGARAHAFLLRVLPHHETTIETIDVSGVPLVRDDTRYEGVIEMQMSDGTVSERFILTADETLLRVPVASKIVIGFDWGDAL